MFLIKYKSDGKGCPDGGIYGELQDYNWNSNDFSDSRFPQPGTVLKFLARHKRLDTDFFYFGSEFICSEKMLEIIKLFRHGRLDIVEVRVHLQGHKPSIQSRKYYLLRSREIRTLLDKKNAVYEIRKDPATNLPEKDIYHDGRYIYDSITQFAVEKKNIDLDFFICSEMLINEYVLSLRLKQALESENLKGISFIDIEKSSYDAKLDF
ncbi:Imm43 family immunity protein [Pseudomonas syringae]|uniref:Imm43 family immunity protein n=1 Tax=Pseudomonas syringae TaxID=317 RepID=UPI001F0FAA6E|nr:hypothetical protein [Pseudomonas syringae]MCH5655179.1 hypothetical protein [Pseudomonas syringae]MCK9689795.1 hypothetical protein [Pseudomonas syringae pv. syringae]MCK9699366.1 hypothetical protein [Pseudomonas syringae pv. syringae]MCK9729774.1 hypothetical protein [Pseudomonas syringae pv. syringae]MDU8600408.1 hypothetical protein [Pseudomonas syringae]